MFLNHLLFFISFYSSFFLTNNFVFISLPVSFWIEFSTFLFFLGMCGIFFNNHNFLTVLLNIEMMLLGIGLLYVGFSVFFLFGVIFIDLRLENI